MKPRAPSTNPGTAALLWAIGLGLYVWLFCLAVGVSNSLSALLAALSAGGIFLFVRVYGGKDLRRPGGRRGA